LLFTELEKPLFLAEGESEEYSEGASKLGTVRMVDGICPFSDFGEFA
jgi:hypothetical protein